MCFRPVITALNLSSFAAAGPLPSDHIPSYRTFRSSQLSPFSTNIQFQRAYLLSQLFSSSSYTSSNAHTNLNHHETISLAYLIHSAFLLYLPRSPNPRHNQRRRRPSHRHRRLPGGQTRHVSYPDVRRVSEEDHTEHGLGMDLSWGLECARRK